ncbi:MAG: ABC transporter permease [Rhodobiaceae bacterium]|nr:ABC transporter permease [Rhodobiaceae bacterium]MCC0018356.1 ABC transporter permease [Rhodobiaceae bacterium]MCC0051149.1 ABC transporter permease [Rhodobiaceae bacterium]MCC0060214.1 ABC transporter permease [Rhodobiaceae bacterium]
MGELFGYLSFGADGWGDEIATGVWLTIRLALVTLPFGLVIGFFVALAKNSEEPLLKAAANVYTTIFRGLPELLTLFIVYYGGQIMLAQIASLFYDGYVEVSGFVAGVVALGVVFSAFASEVFLGALRGIGAGQYEAGYALGLTRAKTLRLIIVPQLIRLALPGLSNLWLVLLKDTSLVSVIALDDLLRKTNIVVGATKEPFFFYSVACLIYLTLSVISSLGINRINTWANRGQVHHP